MEGVTIGLTVARCECRAEQEIVHFLFQCPQWAEQRTLLHQALGNRGSDPAFLQEVERKFAIKRALYHNF